MKVLDISIPEEGKKEYKILLSTDLVRNIKEHFDFSTYSKVVILSDNIVWEHWGEALQEGIGSDTESIIIKSGEEYKSIESYQYVLEQLVELKADRKSLLVNLGGGVIGDLGGFVASSYMRGVDFIQIPTTLLSQVDASVGGKTGFNLAGIKNIIGAFSQPKLVVIDIDTLKTLEERELKAGMAENIKHALIKDEEFFNILSEKSYKEYSEEDWMGLVYRSAGIKSLVVNEDEKEAGVRKLLNLGHTAGHAFESLLLKTDNSLLHGEAVSIGVCMEVKISNLLKKVSDEDYSRVVKSFKLHDLPVASPVNISEEDFFSKADSDKKNTGGVISWTLIEAIGDGSFDNKVEREVVINALKEVNHV